jgi:hypothetical protein
MCTKRYRYILYSNLTTTLTKSTKEDVEFPDEYLSMVRRLAANGDKWLRPNHSIMTPIVNPLPQAVFEMFDVDV